MNKLLEKKSSCYVGSEKKKSSVGPSVKKSSSENNNPQLNNNPHDKQNKLVHSEWISWWEIKIKLLRDHRTKQK